MSKVTEQVVKSIDALSGCGSDFVQPSATVSLPNGESLTIVDTSSMTGRPDSWAAFAPGVEQFGQGLWNLDRMIGRIVDAAMDEIM